MDLIRLWLVHQAVVALKQFCEKYKVRFVMGDSLEFAIAWYTGQSHEWMPCTGGFRRIVTTRPHGDKKQIATVFKETEFDQESSGLTTELNQMIFVATNGEWRS